MYVHKITHLYTQMWTVRLNSIEVVGGNIVTTERICIEKVNLYYGFFFFFFIFNVWSLWDNMCICACVLEYCSEYTILVLGLYSYVGECVRTWKPPRHRDKFRQARSEAQEWFCLKVDDHVCLIMACSLCLLTRMGTWAW